VVAAHNASAINRGPVGAGTSGRAGLSVNDFISKTKSQQRQGLKPSGPELIAYARYLGIDPVADHDLLWIAVEALEAPLPSDWTEHFDGSDRVFYYNATMRVSSWTHPLEHVYRETYKTIVKFRNTNMAPAERAEKLYQLQLEVKQMEYDVHKDIAQWTEHEDENGNRFYFNREERQSTWTDPRPAKCQILYLRMKMLRLLQSGTSGTAGFADSRFAALSGSDSDDPAFKRPKVGAAAVRSSEVGHWPETDTSTIDATRASSPSSFDGNKSDSDSDDDRRKKKKKKKKKKKQRDHDLTSGDERPPRPAQNLKNSQSEPSVGGKTHDSLGGAGSHSSPSGPQAMALSNFADAEGLSTVGRARVKAGIRLEPIAANPPPGSMPPKGTLTTASAPVLQP